MPTTENGLVTAIVKAVFKAHPSAWVFKVVGSPYQMTGIPDLLMCVDGLLIGAEVKFVRPGETHEHALSRATPGQRVQIARINTSGGQAGVVTSVQEALDLIDRGLAHRMGEKNGTPDH